MAVARFKREVESLLKVDHPAIVKVLDHSFDPEPYLLMPLGIQLEKYWVDLRATKPEELFARSQSLVLTLLSGLEAVHPLGIIHRDLKPGNVVVIDDQPVLIDFGVVWQDGGADLTQPDHPVGNKFMGPAGAAYGGVFDESWDLMGLAWLWGWMMGRVQPKDMRFSWKHHMLLDFEAAPRLRALLAASSSEEHCPRSAGAMRKLFSSLGLDSAKAGSQRDAAQGYADAIATAQTAVAQETIAKVNAANVYATTAAMIIPSVLSIIAALRWLAGEVPAGIEVRCTGPAADDPSGLEKAIIAAGGTQNTVPLLTMSCRIGDREFFSVGLVLYWQQAPKACDPSGRSLTLEGWLQLRGIPGWDPTSPAYREKYGVVLNWTTEAQLYLGRGSQRLLKPGRAEDVAEVVRGWLQDASHWK